MSGDTIKLAACMVATKLPDQPRAERRRPGQLSISVQIAKSFPLSWGRVLSVGLTQGAS